MTFTMASFLVLPMLATAVLAQNSSSSGFVCQTGASASYTAEISYLGCYNDSSVSILSAAKLSTIAMTPQLCGNYCGEKGFGYGGIEFGTYVQS
jgi:beta-D-xylosidase 4